MQWRRELPQQWLKLPREVRCWCHFTFPQAGRTTNKKKRKNREKKETTLNCNISWPCTSCSSSTDSLLPLYRCLQLSQCVKWPVSTVNFPTCLYILVRCAVKRNNCLVSSNNSSSSSSFIKVQNSWSTSHLATGPPHWPKFCIIHFQSQTHTKSKTGQRTTSLKIHSATKVFMFHRHCGCMHFLFKMFCMVQNGAIHSGSTVKGRWDYLYLLHYSSFPSTCLWISINDLVMLLCCTVCWSSCINLLLSCCY